MVPLQPEALVRRGERSQTTKHVTGFRRSSQHASASPPTPEIVRCLVFPKQHPSAPTTFRTTTTTGDRSTWPGGVIMCARGVGLAWPEGSSDKRTNPQETRCVPTVPPPPRLSGQPVSSTLQIPPREHSPTTKPFMDFLLAKLPLISSSCRALGFTVGPLGGDTTCNWPLPWARSPGLGARAGRRETTRGGARI